MNDPGSNFNIIDVLPALSRTVDTYETEAIDHSVSGRSASFLLSCGTFDTSLAATVQISADNSTWEDQTADGSGNDLSGSIAEADSLQLDIPNPTKRYTRLSVVAGGTCVFGVTAIAGPKEYIDPGIATLD